MDYEALRESADKYPEEILYPYDNIITIIGFDGICAMSKEFGGSSIYIPSEKRIFAGCIVRSMHDEFNGSNYRLLAKKFGYTERSVRMLIANR